MPPTSEGQLTGQDPSLHNGEIDQQKVDELLRESHNAYELAGMLMGLPDEIVTNSSGDTYTREDLVEVMTEATTPGGNPNVLTGSFGIRGKFFFSDGRPKPVAPKPEQMPVVKRYEAGVKKGEVQQIDLKDQMQLLGYLKAQELGGLNAAEVSKEIDDIEKLFRLGEIEVSQLGRYLEIAGVPSEIRLSTSDIITGNNKPGSKVLGFNRAFETSIQEDIPESPAPLITEVPSFGAVEKPVNDEEAQDEAERAEEIVRLEAELEDSRFDGLKMLINRKERAEADKKAAQKFGNGEGSIMLGQLAGTVQREINAKYPEIDAEYSRIRIQLFDLRNK